MYMKLKDFAEIKLGYSLRGELAPDDSGNVLVIMPRDLDANGKIDFSQATCTNISGKPDKYFLEDGEILLTSRGRFTASVYKSPDSRSFIASSLFLQILVKSKDVLPEYIALYLNSSIGQQQITRISSNATIPAITKQELENLEIPIISVGQQKQLCALAVVVKESAALMNRKLDLQSQIFDNMIIKTIGENK